MHDVEHIRRRLARLAWLLDNSIALPGVVAFVTTAGAVTIVLARAIWQAISG